MLKIIKINTKKGKTKIVIEYATCLIQWRPKRQFTFLEALDMVQQLLKMTANLKHLDVVYS